MPLASYRPHIPLEYVTLFNAKSSGPSIGTYSGRDIPSSVEDGFGRRYDFVSVAPRCWNGKINVGALREGEFLFPPDLVYRMRKPKPVPSRSWPARRLFSR